MVPEEGLAVTSNNATEGRQPTLRRVASQTHTSLRTAVGRDFGQNGLESRLEKVGAYKAEQF